MDNDNGISLRISGTRVRNEGFLTHVSIGLFPVGESERLDSGVLIRETPSFVIRHRPTHIVYKLYDTKVKGLGTDTSGNLVVACAIPRSKKLKNGESPYNLLINAYSIFVRDYMERLLDGRNAFTTKKIEVDTFQELLSKYELEDRKGKYVEMNGERAGIVRVPHESMSAFFADTQYPEFGSFEEIEVGQECISSPSLQYLEIPRRIRYSVFVNDKSSGRNLISDDDVFSQEEVVKDEYQYYPKFSFSFGELKSRAGELNINGVIIRLSTERERIDCIVPPANIQYALCVSLDSLTEDLKIVFLELVANNDIHLYINDVDYSYLCNGGATHVDSEYIRKEPKLGISPSIKDYVFLVKKNVDKDIKSHRITIVVSGKKNSVINAEQDSRVFHGDSEGRHVGGMNNNLGDVINHSHVQSRDTSGQSHHGSIGGNNSNRENPDTKRGKFGIDPISLVLGSLIGLVCALLVLVFGGRLSGREVKQLKLENMSYQQEIEQLKDSLEYYFVQIKSLKDSLETYSDQIKKLKAEVTKKNRPGAQQTGNNGAQGSQSSTVTQENDESRRNQILKLLNQGETDIDKYVNNGLVAKSSNRTGNKKVDDYYALYWVIGFETLVKEYKCEHSDSLTNACEKYKSKAIENNAWTWEMIADYRKAVLRIDEKHKIENKDNN